MSSVDDIKNRLDIVEVIQSYIKLQKAGINYRAVCPFHREKTPSFFVSPSRQIWHCFGSCGDGGDIFKFVMKIEGVEFGDALRILAKKAGVELKIESPALKTERERLHEICELATAFFEKQLKGSKVGKEATEYLLKRGISNDSINKWRLGYAPQTQKSLTDFLVGRGYRRDEMVKAGLSVSSGNDRFRSRIMFPIFDLNNEVIGFGGRIFGASGNKEIAKYLNTPNTLLYDKSRVLYGLNFGRNEIRKKDGCVLVEGYTDVIMSYQGGVENVVSTSGTALTFPQLKMLKRYSENLITAFDMDLAGDTATKRGIDLAEKEGFNIKVSVLDEGKDPADVVKEDASKWKNMIENAKSIMSFYFETTFSNLKYDKDVPEGKKIISKILLPVIKIIPNKIEQAYWISQLSDKLNTTEDSVREELKKVKEGTSFVEEEKKVVPVFQTRKEMLEERFLSLALKTKNIEGLQQDFLPWFSERGKVILKTMQDKNENFPLELKDYLDYLYLKSDVEFKEEDVKDEFKDCLDEIELMVLKEKREDLYLKIKEAERIKDPEKLKELMNNFNELNKQNEEKEEKIKQG